MTLLEKFQDFAYGKGIKVFEIYHESKIKGCCMVDNTAAAVLINKTNIINTQEELCVLVEEIGHIENNAVLTCEYYLNPEFKKWAKRKCEIKATKWAVHTLLPYTALVSAIKKGFKELWELADHFNVTEEFIDRAFYIYQCEGRNLNEDLNEE